MIVIGLPLWIWGAIWTWQGKVRTCARSHCRRRSTGNSAGGCYASSSSENAIKRAATSSTTSLTSSRSQMSFLLTFVRRRKVLVVTLALFSALGVDSLRPPSKQVTARAYVAAVHAYQRVGRPVLSRWVHCQCQPTCSEYSLQAVRTHGIAKGVFLTGCRLIECLHASVRALSESRASMRVQTVTPNFR